MAFNFALRAIYHIDRTDPDDEVVESLVIETLIDSPNGLSISDLTCNVDEEIFGLHGTGDINKLPTGVHVVWAVGTAVFHAGGNYECDDGGEFVFDLSIEEWSLASNGEIREAEASSGASLSEFLKPEPFL